MAAAWAAVQGCLLGVYFVSDSNDVFIRNTPTSSQWVILALLAAAIPLAALLGWLVSRVSGGRTRAAVSTASVAFAVTCGVIESGPIQLIRDAVILVLTGCGVGYGDHVVGAMTL